MPRQLCDWAHRHPWVATHLSRVAGRLDRVRAKPRRSVVGRAAGEPRLDLGDLRGGDARVALRHVAAEGAAEAGLVRVDERGRRRARAGRDVAGADEAVVATGRARAAGEAALVAGVTSAAGAGRRPARTEDPVVDL